jgi:signal transduction histidine kinase
MYGRVVRWADSPAGRIQYVHVVNWIERRLERLRSFDPFVVDGVLAVIFTVIGIAFVFGQDIRDDDGVITDGFREPSALAIVTVLVVCAPVAIRRRLPLLALVVSSIGIVIHILIGWPEGALPLAMLFLTYTVGAWCSLRTALAGLAVIVIAIVALGFADSPGLDTVGVLGILAQFIAVWAVGVALRSRRMATDSKLREAEERAEAERQGAARVLAEERLRIAQELHDVVAHSMSVIAVQAGVGAHVIDDRPEEARSALEAISSTSRGTLHELRQLLGVLRGTDDGWSNAPAHGLADLPQLVDDVRVAGVPVTLHVEGDVDGEVGCVQPGVELSAYRVVQEALTNVIKHAGSPSRVDVTVRHLPGTLVVEVVDDGRGLAAQRPDGTAGEASADGAGHGLVGMRERVELWGGELAVGPGPRGGYRVKALLPYGDPT